MPSKRKQTAASGAEKPAKPAKPAVIPTEKPTPNLADTLGEMIANAAQNKETVSGHTQPPTPKGPPAYKRTKAQLAQLAKSMTGNRNAEKWSETVVLNKLTEMLLRLQYDSWNNVINEEDPIAANNIRLQKHVCLLVGITGKIFSEWKEKFCKTELKNKDGDLETNRNYSRSVSDLITRIEDICECRLVLEGGKMSQFVLVNHYDYVDRRDVTTNGKDLPTSGPVAAQVTIIENF